MKDLKHFGPGDPCGENTLWENEQLPFTCVFVSTSHTEKDGTSIIDLSRGNPIEGKIQL